MKKKNVIEQYKNLSFSEASKKIADKYKHRDTDLIQKNSFLVEIEALSKHQEQKKAEAETKEQFKRGGKLPQYPYGGELYKALGQRLSSGLIGQNVDRQEALYPTIPPATIDPLATPFSPVTSTTFPNLEVRTNPELFQVPGSNQFSTPKDVPGSKTGMNAYTPAFIGQGISTAINAGILASGYDKVAPVDNPYENTVKRLMAERSIDTTQQRNQILSSYNAARSGLNNARSSNIRTALDANLMGTTQDALANSKLQEQQINNQYVGDYTGILNNLGQQKVGATNLSQDLTARNKSQFENNLSFFGDLLAQHGESFSAFKANQNMNTALSQLLNTKHAASGLGVSQEVIDKFNKGQATEGDWIQLMSAIKQTNPSITIPNFNPQ